MALENTALRLIRKFGDDRLVTLQVPTGAPADPAKPFDNDPTSQVSSLTVPAVVVPIDRKLINGESVLEGDEQALIAGLSMGTVEPLPDSVLIDEGIKKNIIQVDKVKPGKTVYLYKIQIRAP